MGKGISIYYDEQDLNELHEFIKWKTKRAGTSQSDSMMTFSAGSFDVDNSLDETTKLIAEAQHELQRERELMLEQQQRIAQVGQQRDSVSQLADLPAQAEIERIREEKRLQGLTYASEKNAGRSGKVYETEDQKSIRDGVISWIESKRRKGHFGGQKALNKK